MLFRMQKQRKHVQKLTQFNFTLFGILNQSLFQCQLWVPTINSFRMNFTITQWLQKESNGRIIFFYPFEIEKKRKFQEEKFLFIRSGIEPETLRLQLSAPSLFYLQDCVNAAGIFNKIAKLRPCGTQQIKLRGWQRKSDYTDCNCIQRIRRRAIIMCYQR